MYFAERIHGHGTLSADMIVHRRLLKAATLVGVDASATTAAVGTVKVGTDADDDLYLVAKDVGASNTPKVYGRADFVGAEYPHIPAGTVLKITVAHGSMIHPDICLHFLEG